MSKVGWLSVFALVACGDDTDVDDAGQNVSPICTEPVAVPCEDEAFGALSLNEIEASSAMVSTNQVGGIFRSTVDATAGGFGAQPQGAYVYVRFRDSGLERLNLTDTEALSSMDWDMAFQRFRIRLNSGTSGPSCVAAARLPDDANFTSLDSAPENAEFRQENFFSSSCTVIADGANGPFGGPQFVMGGYYTYTTCLTMNGSVYIIQLANGRQVKFTVDSYYERSAQDACNSDSDTFAPTGSGTFAVNWAFLN
ncbi:MAG: HmuY family protein [Myxococcota bacterium]